ncbi:MAG: glycosyltransferase family 1 protein [Puniceicoccaceae bacterium]|nr:MAG: glycosyltransferase family 1 protein [Puniceicoccaceae bacterium]
MPHAIEFAPPDPAAVAAFDLPRDRFHFLFMYDLNSYQERKNPAAVIRAFRRAFPDPDAARVGLVIKVHSLRGNEAAFASLREQLADLPGARLIAETLPRARVYALLAACDAFVSLHRSEGFGLAVAEAMFLGKPVISTDWSATAEFVNQSNGFPVRASTIRLTESIGPYARGQEWADPDLDHAAHQMRRCAEDAALRDAVGRAAAATIRERFSPKTIGERYRRRLQTILLWD